MALSGTTVSTTINGKKASVDIGSALSSGTYITSGFSNYNGHSAIGVGSSEENNTYLSGNQPCIGIGTIAGNSLRGIIVELGSITTTIDTGTMSFQSYSGNRVFEYGAIVF